MDILENILEAVVGAAFHQGGIADELLHVSECFGEVQYIGDTAVLTVKGAPDGNVTVGIRPEGFIMDKNGALRCNISNVEVMGRDVSIVSTHNNSLNPTIRSIIDADEKPDADATVATFALKPHKVFLFDAETEERIYFEV